MDNHFEFTNIICNAANNSDSDEEIQMLSQWEGYTLNHLCRLWQDSQT